MADTLYVIKEGKSGSVSITESDWVAGGTAALVMQTAPRNPPALSKWYVVLYFTKAHGPTELTMTLPTTWWQLIHLPDGLDTANADIEKIVGAPAGNPTPVHPDDDPPPGVVSGPGHI
jgi:hypothetical protein